MNKERRTEKGAWQKPELIVLVRSKPEEAVLQACKWDNGGPKSFFDSTCTKEVLSGLCDECAYMTQS